MNERRGIRGLAFFVGAAVVAAVCGHVLAQEPILTFSVPTEPIPVRVGGTAEVVVSIENRSIREADDITAEWLSPEAFASADPSETIVLLPPFERGQLRVRISAPGSAVEGEIDGRLVVGYTYCVLGGAEEQCYEFAEELAVPLLVVAPVPVDGSGSPTDGVGPAAAARPLPWAWIGFAIAGLLAGSALLLGSRARRRGAAVVGLVLVVAGALAYGVARNQHEQAQAIGSVLCTSCVGIEEARSSADVRLSVGAVEALRSLDEDVRLTVFYAEWCHSCPYAEGMVERMAEVSDRIDYRFVDVDVRPELAARYGIVRAGRTVVPAIVRDGSSRVLFGVENLEERLLDLVGAGR